MHAALVCEKRCEISAIWCAARLAAKLAAGSVPSAAKLDPLQATAAKAVHLAAELGSSQFPHLCTHRQQQQHLVAPTVKGQGSQADEPPASDRSRTFPRVNQNSANVFGRAHPNRRTRKMIAIMLTDPEVRRLRTTAAQRNSRGREKLLSVGRSLFQDVLGL